MTKKVVIFAGFLLMLTGCATYYYGGYVNPEKENYKIKTIAVIPFSTPKDQPNAGTYISDLLTTQLLQTGFMIVDKERESDAIITGSIGEYGYRNQNIKVNIERLNIFIGTQTPSFNKETLAEWLREKEAIKPVVALTVKLIEKKSNTILWVKNFSLSPSESTLSETAEELIAKIVDEINYTFQGSSKNRE